MKNPPVIHPFLIAIFPSIFFVSYNIGEISLNRLDAIFIAVILPLVSFLLWLLLSLILKNKPKAGILVSLFFFISFSYTPVYDILLKIFKFEDDFNQILNPAILDKLLLSVSLLLFLVVGYWIIRTRRSLSKITKIINVFAICLVLLSLFRLGIYQIKNYSVLINSDRSEKIEKEIAGKKDLYRAINRTLPDIYYIVPDRYPSQKSLREFFGYENTEFVDYLRKKGFFVASDSYANYPKTSWSLASSLNFEYIDYLNKFSKEGVIDLKPLHQMIKYHKVGAYLRSKGYRYIHLGSGDVERTDKSPMADINLAYTSVTELMLSIYEISIFYHIALELGWEYDSRLIQRERVLYTFQELAKIPDMDSEYPKFVFAHILLPHSPYVFEANGELKSSKKARQEPFKKKYLDQLKFANMKLTELIDKLLANSKVPPIIIIQSDEGTLPERFKRDERNFDWRTATGAELREKFGILNAYYLPGFDYNLLYPGITPVNTFRLIFNHYFNAEYDLLEDKNYIFVKILYPYQFIDITEKLRSN